MLPVNVVTWSLINSTVTWRVGFTGFLLLDVELSGLVLSPLVPMPWRETVNRTDETIGVGVKVGVGVLVGVGDGCGVGVLVGVTDGGSGVDVAVGWIEVGVTTDGIDR
jgi:hypothetical protein